MSKINATFYTKGKFTRVPRITTDIENEYLYSKGRYPTKIKKEDLPEDYIEFRSRVIWYMTGYLKTSEIVDINYKALEINHLFKDDYIYISYHDKLRLERDEFGYEDYANYDICICGNDIIPIVLAARKYSNVNIEEVQKKINAKVEWYRRNCEEDYIRQFGDKEIDVFELYK